MIALEPELHIEKVLDLYEYHQGDMNHLDPEGNNFLLRYLKFSTSISKNCLERIIKATKNLNLTNKMGENCVEILSLNPV